MPKNKKNHNPSRLPVGSPRTDLQVSPNLERQSRRKANFMDLSIAHPALLYAFQNNMNQLNYVFPSRYEVCFVRNPLKQIPCYIASFLRMSLLSKTGFSTILVKKLFCAQKQVPMYRPQFGNAIFGRVFTQKHEQPPLNKASLVRNGCVRSVAFHPSGRFIAIGTRHNVANTAHIFNVSSNGSSASCVNPPLKTSNMLSVNSIAWHPSAPVMATVGDDNAFKVVLLSSEMNVSCISTHYSHTKSVNSVKFNTDGSCIATGSDDKTAKLWRPNFDFTSWTCTATLNGHNSGVRSVAFHPTAFLLATASADQTTKLWQLSSDNSSATCVATLEGHTGPVNSVVFHPTIFLLATGSFDKTTKLWRLSPNNSSATCVATLEGHTGPVNSVAFHPTALLLATGSHDKTAKLWRVSADNSFATCVATLKGHTGPVNSVAFHPNTPLFATGSDDNTAKLWR